MQEKSLLFILVLENHTAYLCTCKIENSLQISIWSSNKCNYSPGHMCSAKELVHG